MLLVRRAEVLQAGGGVARLRRCFELEQVDWLGVRGCGARVKAGVGGRRRESCVGAACSRGLVDARELEAATPDVQEARGAVAWYETIPFEGLRARQVENEELVGSGEGDFACLIYGLLLEF